MSLSSNVALLAGKVRDKLNLMTPRLLPAGGVVGQQLVKASSADYVFQWGNRVEAYTGMVTDSAGRKTITFAVPFTTPPFLMGQVYQSSTGDVRATSVEVLDLTRFGCTLQAYRSLRGSLLGLTSTVDPLPGATMNLLVVGS